MADSELQERLSLQMNRHREAGVWGPGSRPQGCVSGFTGLGSGSDPCRRRGGGCLPTSALSQWDLSLGLWKADRAMNIWAR